MKALSDETRFKIVNLLLEKNYCVRALSKQLKISESAVSQHLKILKSTEILIGEKRGYFMHYKVNKSIFKKASKEIYKLTEIEKTSECNHQFEEYNNCCKKRDEKNE